MATDASAYYAPDRFDMGLFGVNASPRKGIGLAALEKAVLAELQSLIDSGVTEDEVARAKKSIMAGAIYARDSLRAGPHVFGRALTSGRTVADVESWPERIGAVTRAEVEAAARAVLKTRRSVTSVLLPDKAG